MELKSTNISLFVGFFVLNSLLEFAVFLEPVLLRHLAFLLICLHDSTLRAKCFHLSFKQSILAKLTL